ncbi:hypothetical protein [Conexibacter sp. DBS9H8]|uniref:hypothetical protein n=1 Tax=Conexibacter sp. DBS9H8 TaxID=2937801 RepID=UPI00201051BB|nr:hypothetical protein [Conexibacter sp. DBS9H8]
MTESKLFVSSCSRRELALRRRHSRLVSLAVSVEHPRLTACLFAFVCVGAFLAGRGGF